MRLGSFIHIGAGFDINFKIEIRIVVVAYIRSKRKFSGGDRAILRTKDDCRRSPDACQFATTMTPRGTDDYINKKIKAMAAQ